MVPQGFKGASLTRAATAAAIALILGFALAIASAYPRQAHAASIADGEYELDIAAYQATQEQLSMCDGALVKPATLTVAGSQATLQVEVQPVKVGVADGYLGILQCFPNWNSASAPSEDDAVDADVVSVYKGVKDEYNNAKSADSLMKGVSYPKVVSFPWNVESDECYLRVYVPVMEAISSGSGWQLVRLRADYDTLKRIDGSDGEDPAEQSSSSSSSEATEPQESDDNENPGSTSSSSSSSQPGESKSSTKSSSSSSEDSSSSSSSSTKASEALDFKELPDGTFTIRATFVKTDRATLSMGDAAIDHTLTLHVSKGVYRLDLKLGQVTFSGQSSYLGSLRYFKAGYGTDAYGAPTGATGSCKVLAYQTQGGARVSDSYGTDYPALVRIPVIPEAKSDGFVPLQAFVPVMDAIAAGTGTQSMYLKLDTSSVAREGEESPEGSSSSSSSAAAPSQSASEAGADAPGGTVISSNTLPSGGSSTIAGVSSQANSAKSGTTSTLKQGSTASSAKPATASTSSSASSRSSAASGSVSVTPISMASTGVSAGEAEKQPPLRNAALPIGVAGGAAFALGVGGTLIRRRDSLFDEEL